ncbi:MAG: DUF4265 domain-containing protein [Chitinophagaceae bacterium]|nr:MAG: DUF4265 domain-containing protein [Chitinophagaceae bacterium]
MTTSCSDISITLPYNNNGTPAFEQVTCHQIGDYYMIASVPAFADTVAPGDIVLLEESGGLFYVDTVISPSGHSVVQIAICMPGFGATLAESLRDLGVASHLVSDGQRLLADIPPSVNYTLVTKLLSGYAEQGLISYRPGCTSDDHACG